MLTPQQKKALSCHDLLLPGHRYQCRERQHTAASPSTLYKMTAFYRSLKRLISPPGGMVNRAFLCLMGCSSQRRRACCRGVVLTHSTTAPVCSLGALTHSALAGCQGRGCQAGTPLHTEAALPSAPAPLPSLVTLPPHAVLLREQGQLLLQPGSPPCPTPLGLGGRRARAWSVVGAARSSTDFTFETVSTGPHAAWQERHASEIQLLL